jgi:nucleoid-associated protein EbfC
MFDFMGMMGKVKEAQAKIKETQAKLVHLRAEGESGAGLVKVSGTRQVLTMELDESLLNPQDREMLSDLIVAATNKAMEAIDEKIKQEMKTATEGMIPSIPGMDLGNLFG